MEWQLIETAPADVDLLLGWWSPQPDPTPAWIMEMGLAVRSNTCSGGYSNGWMHSWATHWMPLPEPPHA